MTEKQELRLRDKIDKYKKELEADKRRWGGFYNDGRGIRYLLPELYLKLNDYEGALKYFKWFEKKFSKDIGTPIFNFEWSVTLFKNGKLKEAEKKALETHFSNTYIFDKFFNRNLYPINKSELSSDERIEFTKYLKYSADNPELKDFAEWLINVTESEKFSDAVNKFTEISVLLLNEHEYKKRHEMNNRLYALLDNYI